MRAPLPRLFSALPSDVLVTLPADVSQPLLAASGFLSGGETDPRGKLASASKRRRVSHGGSNSRADERTNPGDRRQTLTDGVCLVPSNDTGIDLVDPFGDGIQL
jgi:hypothetical protein